MVSIEALKKKIREKCKFSDLFLIYLDIMNFRKVNDGPPHKQDIKIPVFILDLKKGVWDKSRLCDAITLVMLNSVLEVLSTMFYS